MNTNNIYKDNLNILRNLKSDESIYYEGNSILLDDRILSNYRYGNNIKKIAEIIKISFLHFYNLALIIPGEKKEIIKILETTIKKIQIFINNKHDDKIFSILLKDLEKLMTELYIDKGTNDKGTNDKGTNDKGTNDKEEKNTSFKFIFDNLNNKYNFIQRLKIKITNLLNNLFSYFF